jgi:hypothetical protein
MKLTGENRSTRGKTCPSATLSTTNPTRIDPGLRDERPATSRLSHGTAMNQGLFPSLLSEYRADNLQVCCLQYSGKSHNPQYSNLQWL